MPVYLVRRMFPKIREPAVGNYESGVHRVFLRLLAALGLLNSPPAQCSERIRRQQLKTPDA